LASELVAHALVPIRSAEETVDQETESNPAFVDKISCETREETVFHEIGVDAESRMELVF